MYQTKIALITPSLKAGGLEKVVSMLASYGAGKYSIVVIMLTSEKPFFTLDEKVQLTQTPLKITTSNKVKRFFTNGYWLRKTITAIEPNIICSFGEKYNPYVLLSLAGLNIPIYVANRASPMTYLKGYRGIITPMLYKLASGVILQTQKSEDLLQPRYHMKNTCVIGNPIDIVYPQNKGKLIILNVGSIGGNKNQDWLISYFNELKSKKALWELHFLGDGVKRKYCEGLVDSYGIQDKVVFHGVKKNPKAYYTNASIFAFTSTSEGFPNALAEAMAAGCACIAYDCVAGPSDIIDDGISGFLIPVGDEEQYKEKLQLLMMDEELRRRFGEAAREKMKQFEASKIAKRFYEFITEPID